MPPRKSKTPTSPIDAVSSLLTERTKFEQWLDDLAAKKDSTPPKVYDRVHHDYLGRLQGVMDQLKEHTTTLQEHGQALNKKLIELSSAEESRVEERSEAELRAKVGEMTAAEWDSVSKRADKELAKLKQDKASIEDELERIESVLEDLMGNGEKPDSAPKKVDELEFLKSVVGTGPRPAAKPPESRPSGPSGATPVRPSGEGAKTATPAAGSPAAPSAPAAAPAAPPAAPPAPGATPAAGTPTHTPPAGAPSAAAAAKATPPAGIDKEPGPAVSDQPKTLKCQECSTMNYPSEWYCERCGAELTVV